MAYDDTTLSDKMVVSNEGAVLCMDSALTKEKAQVQRLEIVKDTLALANLIL